ncbi:MAG: MarR family transcriptional regulator, partial [Cyanobacteria bacterium J06632_3]
AFGLHHPEKTPCGQSVSVAEAHALIELTKVVLLSQGELSQRLDLEKSTVSRLVSSLDRRGWIRRDRNPADRRIVEIQLTDAGKQTAAALSAARQAKFNKVLSAIPTDRQDDVIDALNILVEAIRESQ